MKNTIEKVSQEGVPQEESKNTPEKPLEKLENEIKRHVEAFIKALEYKNEIGDGLLDAESVEYAEKAKESAEVWIQKSRRELAQMTGDRKFKSLWQEKRRLVGMLYDKELMRRFMVVAERYGISFDSKYQFSGMTFIN
jgi:hypothetical protein